MIRIDKKLNLTFSVDSGDGQIFVHAAPLSADVFRRYYRIIAKAYSQIWGEGLRYVWTAGWRTAALTIEDIAKQDNVWDGPDGVENGLINEMIRLTNVFVAGDNGWEMLPLDTALKQGRIDEEAGDLTRNAIVFFILASSIEAKKTLEQTFRPLLKVWDGQLTSSRAMEFQSSLPISTATDSSSAKTPAA